MLQKWPRIPVWSHAANIGGKELSDKCHKACFSGLLAETVGFGREYIEEVGQEPYHLPVSIILEIIYGCELLIWHLLSLNFAFCLNQGFLFLPSMGAGKSSWVLTCGTSERLPHEKGREVWWRAQGWQMSSMWQGRVCPSSCQPVKSENSQLRFSSLRTLDFPLHSHLSFLSNMLFCT